MQTPYSKLWAQCMCISFGLQKYQLKYHKLLEGCEQQCYQMNYPNWLDTVARNHATMDPFWRTVSPELAEKKERAY